MAVDVTKAKARAAAAATEPAGKMKVKTKTKTATTTTTTTTSGETQTAYKNLALAGQDKPARMTAKTTAKTTAKHADKPVYKNLVLAGLDKPAAKKKRKRADPHEQAGGNTAQSQQDEPRHRRARDSTRDETTTAPTHVEGPSRKGPSRNGGTASPLARRADALLQVRRGLPIWPYADEIRANLRRTDVMLLVGETGSGKSTQIPQFLVDERWCRPVEVAMTRGPGDDKPPDDGQQSERNERKKKKKKKKKKGDNSTTTTTTTTIGGCIAITQPRRVAAISLARRVAEESGTPLGAASPASTVGYAVRFDSCVSPRTRIKYLTEGMLLQL
ncbi:putative ATP-dependent RNA helicase dhr2 [Ascosphaera acerosa]|nr:putative ATP-dependent RNA helicase dhr2 [Ascosphaera acerosa]